MAWPALWHVHFDSTGKSGAGQPASAVVQNVLALARQDWSWQLRRSISDYGFDRPPQLSTIAALLCTKLWRLDSDHAECCVVGLMLYTRRRWRQRQLDDAMLHDAAGLSDCNSLSNAAGSNKLRTSPTAFVSSLWRPQIAYLGSQPCPFGVTWRHPSHDNGVVVGGFLMTMRLSCTVIMEMIMESRIFWGQIQDEFQTTSTRVSI